MPNTQTSVPAFVAAQVLTAQQQTEINTGIPVFATTVTRDAAFGGAGEKALAEGQFAYIEATNTTQYYDGAAWQSVGASSGLTFISKTSFSAVSSVSLAASTFTSTYKNYRTIFLLTAASTTLSITLRLRASGTDNSSALYQQMSTGLTQVTGNTSNLGQNNTTSWDVNGVTTSAQYGLVLDVLGPQTATTTQIQGQLTCDNNSSYVGRSVNGLHNSTTSFDALSYIASTGTFTGAILVYGYTES